jgi:hypothetical protein
MKNVGRIAAALLVLIASIVPVISSGTATAAPIAGETFRGISTQANQWTSGGGDELACLTAATTNAANSIPACTEGPLDSAGSGALRLTSATNSQSGFAFYNTAIPSDEGLKVSFDMYQYGSTSGTGADGISFFLIDGTANPTIPGALGGSLGYSSSDGGDTPGLVGGYVGVGFDRYGNFSDENFGTDGIGRVPNSIAVRGSEDSGYQYVTTKVAEGSIANDGTNVRANALRKVIVSISTNNIMTVSVDYNDGEGYVTELSGLDLNTINGEGSLPDTFKFGFAASTGGSNNIHEINGLSIDPLDPKLKLRITNDTGFKQDEAAQYTIYVENDEGAEETTDDITVISTLPDGMKPSSAAGDGWTCSVVGQVVSCTRPGSGPDALQPGEETPGIVVKLSVDEELSSSQSITTTAETANGAAESGSEVEGAITVVPSADDDTIADSIEAAAPNDGDANDDGLADDDQATVTSFKNPLTNKYAVLQTTGCTGNTAVSQAAPTTTDKNYAYPVGLMNFKVNCSVGGTATVTMYYYGLTSSNLALRKFNPVTSTYTTVAGATFSGITIDGQQATKITYDITDGGPLDADGVANGVIVDPAGPAVLGASVTAPNTGLNARPLLPLYGAALLGFGLVAVQTRRILLAQAARSS